MKPIYFALLLIASILSSCSLTRPIKTFDAMILINPQLNIKAAKHQQDAAISVTYSDCSNRFNSQLFFYKKGYKFLPYSHTQWIDSLCNMMSANLYSAIVESKTFRGVIPPKSMFASDYKLIFFIKDFEPIFTKHGNFVLTDIVFTLLNTKTNRAVLNYEFKDRSAIHFITMKNISQTMNQSAKYAIESIVNKIITYISKH